MRNDKTQKFPKVKARELEIQQILKNVYGSLVEKGYDEKYGARPLKRTIQQMVEDKLAEAVLEGRVREGDSVKIVLNDGQLKFSARHP